ncbi:MAG: GTP cyclohydrolase IIa [Thaumarchaeota archaeon]|nr:GTP cyclohydrolase IIa [Nitrososphaerota archaeon]
MIQITIIKITGYGPWTLTLGGDREHKLQMLQASLYREIQSLFSEKRCLAFPNRFDEIFVISNGLSVGDHAEIQEALSKVFDLGLTMTIGQGKTPLEANMRADDARRMGLFLDEKHGIYGHPLKAGDEAARIIHMDVDGSTSISSKKSPYEVSSLIVRLYAAMSEFFLGRDSLAFFMGGDNFMIIAAAAEKEEIAKFLELVRGQYGISFNCGIGTARTGRDAAMMATKSLDRIRELRDAGRDEQRILELTC